MHLQRDLPANVTGVSVTLTAIGSDGTVIDIGTTTTSGYYGTYEMAWTPPAEGTYKIIASFASDDSYGSSAASTAVSVGPIPVVTPASTQTPIVMPPYEMYTLGTGVAIIVAIAVVAVLLLRKRP